MSLVDDHIARADEVARAANRMRAETRRRLVQLRAELAALAIAATAGGALGTLFADAQSLVRRRYAEMLETITRDLERLGREETDFARETVNREADADIMREALVPQARAAIVGEALHGATLAEWLAGQANETERRFRRLVTQSVAARENVAGIATRIDGEPMFPFGVIRQAAELRVPESTDVVAVSLRDAASLVRTAANAVGNRIRMATYRANPAGIAGTRHVSIIDDVTTEVCLHLDGGAWGWDGQPLPFSSIRIPDPGPPPMWWNCRSVRVPVLRPHVADVREAA
jgi:hypothetical protein